VYAWIFYRLPFGLAGRIVISALLILGVAALLWFWVFPLAEPLLPFDDAQVTSN
jgi:hypothetical protein